ncbi:MAG: acylphosphatase [Gemmatimonadaceae bacterium]
MSVVRLVVTGQVQGVGFRWFVRERASALGLGGWVRNRSDGAVEITVSGEAPVVDELISLVEKGPPGARIGAVRRLDPEPGPTDLPRPFVIRH